VTTGGAEAAVALLEADSEDAAVDETADASEAENEAAMRAFADEHNIDLQQMSDSDMRLMQQHGFFNSIKKLGKAAASMAGKYASKAGGLVKRAAKKLAKKAARGGLSGLKALGKGLKALGKGVINAAKKAMTDEDEIDLGDGTTAADQAIRKRHAKRKAERRRKEREEYREREKERRRKRGRKPFNGVGRRHWGKNADLPEVWRGADAVEDCVACQYVWKQVEQDVGASPISQTIYESFTHNAKDAERSPVFYPATQAMFEAIDDMTNDYMLGYTVDQICENSMLCRPRNLDAFLKHQRKQGPYI